MTALEAFNALNNREVSRKEVEQVLTQAKAENNTAIIYRLSQALNNSPEATHFEITITQYDSAAGLSGVQHTGDYREALDDCGRLRKGWKFVKGNVVKVEEKPKKEAKPKKEKAAQKERKNIENTVTLLHTERFKDDLSYDALERSYAWISFDPEKRAKREQQDWADSMEQLYNSHAEQAQQTGALEAYNAAFEKGYASLLKNYKEMISIRARTFSTGITGGAGITARKIASNESLIQREYEKLKTHNQEVEKLKNKLAKIAKNTPADQYETGEVVKSVDVNAIAKLQDKIKQLEEKKEYIYRQQKAEKEYKKSKDSSVFEKYDIKKEDVEEMLDEINRYGYALYSSPANINAEIRRIRERITGLEKNQSKGEEEILIEGGKIVKNGATQRLQIFFDGIPDKDVREKLKKHAFKWAPSVKAWQRTLTPNAIWDVEHNLLATGILKKQGLSGVQHTGDYREALDDCGRLRKGWKFVKGNVVKVEEKPKKEAKPKKEKAPQKETKKEKKYKFVVITDALPSRVIAVFSYTNPNIEELSERFWKNSEGKYYETTEEGLRNYTFGIGFYPFEKAKKQIEKKYTEGKDFIYFRNEKDGDRDEAISLVEKPKKEAKPKKEKAPQKEEPTKEVSGPKVKDFEAFDYLQTQLLAENADIPKSEVLDFLYNFTDAFEEGKTVFRFWNTPGKKPTEVVLQYKKHPLLTRLQNPSAKMRAYELTPRGYELLEKFHKGVERIKKTYDLGYIAGIHKLSNFLEDRKAYAKKENVQDSSKKEVEKAPTKATKPVKSREENGQNVANFTLLQEPTKVFLKFEDEENETYYKKSADKQGAVGTDFLKKVLKDLKKQNLREEPRGFINTEDFPVKPTISKITGIDSLKTIVAKDDLRPALECVLIEANHYVATDANNIILLNRPKNDGLKTGALYDPNYKCTKIGGCSKHEYYRDIERGYPNYKAALTENPVYTSDWVAIEPIIQHLKSGLEVVRKIYDRKRVYAVKITSNVGEGHYNLKNLLNNLQVLQSNGAKKIRLYTNKLENKSLNIETDNGNTAITSPAYVDDRPNSVEVISPLRIAPIQLHFTQNRKEEKGLSGVDNFQGLFGALGLNAPRHEGILKEALTEKGKLKKGWYFQDYGIIDPKGKYHPLEREFAYEYKVASDELNSRAFEQNEKRKRKGFEENIQLQDNLKDFFKSLSQKYKKYFKNYKAVEIFYWAFNFGEKPTKFFTIDETNPYNETQLKVFDKYFSNKNELFTRLENYETLRRYNLTDLGYNIISEIDSFLIKEGKKVRGDIKKINKKYGLNAPFVPEVSTERFKQMSVPELREYTLEYYLENYGGKSLSKKFFKEEDIHIEFFNTAGKKLQKPIYKEKVAVLEHLESLIKNSTYNNWGNRKESSPPNIIGYLNFKAKVTIDGEKRHVRISIAVDRDRKFRFKTLEVGANPKKKKQATSIPAPWVTESLRDSSLSEDKGTKKSLSRKKKDENFGLNAPEAPVTSLTVPRQTLAQQLAKSPEVRESFLVADEQMSLFLGALEKKTKDSLVITLTGKQGSGKTRFAFQFMNALAQRYRVGHASIEEHPESVLYEEKAYQYLNDTALEHITAQDVRSLAELDTMIRTNEVIVIDSFQKMRELAPHFEIDKDLRKKYDGKLFLVIFQQTADGKMRGGSKSQFDGDIILFTETFPDYRENYVYPDKNRYNKRPATELQYSIYEQRMLATASEVPALPAHYEPTESEELNFEVL